jgi:hypothetical protein
MRHLLPALSLLGIGCTVEVPGWPMPPGLDGIPAATIEAGVTSTAIDGAPEAGERDHGGHEGKPCPGLEGAWGGTCSGKLAGLTSIEVTGTLSLTLKPDTTAGDYRISAGEWTSAPKSAPASKTTQPLSGVIRCGVLDLPLQVTLYGIKASGKITCVFDESGCKGSWSGKATSGTGSGSFELRRK